ncbi:MAG: TonB-dependent receptor, partial [Verrucomicrobiota bacterium]
TLQGDFYRGVAERLANEEITLGGGNILGRWTRAFSDEKNFTLQAYYDQTHRDVPGTYVQNVNTYDVDFQYHFGIGERHNVVLGASYQLTHETVGTEVLVRADPPTLDRNLFAGFVQDEITIRDDLLFTIGTKLEHNSYSKFELQPSVRLSYQLTTNQFLWGAISRAVRTPSRIDEDIFIPATPPYALAGGNGFNSEEVLAYEIGYRAQLHRNVLGSLSTFYNVYDDLRTVNPVTRQIENGAEGETYGFETELTYQVLESWRLKAGYTLLQEHFRVKSGRSDLNNGLAEKSDPQQQVSLRSYLDLPGRLELDTSLRWIDTLRSVNNGAATRIPDYVSLNVRLGWRATDNLEFSVVGQNLVDRHHPEFNLSREIERSVYGKVTWRF